MRLLDGVNSRAPDHFGAQLVLELMAVLVLTTLDTLVGDARTRSHRRVEQEQLLVEPYRLARRALVREVLVQRKLVLEDDLVEVLELLDLRHELLEV